MFFLKYLANFNVFFLFVFNFNNCLIIIMKYYCLLGFFFTINLIRLYAHPVHISVTSVEIINENKKIKVLIKAFKEDIELALFHNYEYKVDNFNENLDTNLLNKYLTNNLYIKSKKVKEYTLNGVEFDADNYYIMYTIILKQMPDKLIFVNHLFNDINFDQKNLMIIKCRNYEKGFELDNFNTTFELNFKEINW